MSAAKPRCPKGWRVLRRNEIIRAGDRFFNTVEDVCSLGWNKSLSIGFTPADNHNQAIYIRRIPEARQ